MSPAIRTSAVRFIIALGMISLLADVTYEGARSITGPFLGSLGAGAAAIGLIAGFGELCGFALRLFSGFAADRTKSYWTLTFAGYIVNLCAVPLLAFADRWEIAALLIVLERAGKAVRTPSRDVMLSQAAHITGRGWGFGLHEAMDQTGALIGPLIVAFVLARSHDYHHGFGILVIPAGLAVLTLITARMIYPDPSRFEQPSTGAAIATRGFPRRFWIYVIGAGLIAAGIADFALIAFHFQQAKITSQAETPVFYAAAMGVEALAALIFGRLFDRIGVAVVIIGVVLSAIAHALVFGSSFYPALIGMMLWGAGMGAQNSALRAGIANIVAQQRRGAAYGIFNTAYGLFWFAGSALMGLIYTRSIMAVIVFGVVCELAAAALLFAGTRRSE